jgi:hypothetical protein
VGRKLLREPCQQLEGHWRAAGGGDGIMTETFFGGPGKRAHMPKYQIKERKRRRETEILAIQGTAANTLFSYERIYTLRIHF